MGELILAAILLLPLISLVVKPGPAIAQTMRTVAVASSLYPVTTVLLAAALLGERVRGTQRIGVVVALCGVVLISAGA